MASVRLQHALALSLALGCAPSVASAQHGDDRVAFGDDAVVASSETVASVAVFGGDAIIEGRVTGDVVSFGGDVELAPSAHVSGSVASIGGRVAAAHGARYRETEGWAPPVIAAHGSHGGVGAWLEETFRQIVAHGLLFLLALLLTGVVPERMRTLHVAIVRDPIRTGFTGLAGYVGSAILILLLAITILGIPAAVALALVLPIATYVGLAASAGVIGACIPIESLRDAPVRRLAAGVLVLFVASLVPLLGTLVVVVASCLGLGALVRTRFDTNVPRDLAERPDVIPSGPYRTSST